MRERRRYPRIEKVIPVTVGRGPGQMATQTVNLSCSGALCRLPAPMPPMTKVAVALALPARLIQCTGVVVRCARAQQAYEVALFFPEISRQDHRAIAEFVLDDMLTHAHGHRPAERD